LTLFEVAREITERLTRIFLRDERGRRPVYGEAEKFQSDPHWRDHLLFYEYFHGDNGAGVGASHQTGWTGLVGTGVELFGLRDASIPWRLARRPSPAAARRRGEQSDRCAETDTIAKEPQCSFLPDDLRGDSSARKAAI